MKRLVIVLVLSNNHLLVVVPCLRHVSGASDTLVTAGETDEDEPVVRLVETIYAAAPESTSTPRDDQFLHARLWQNLGVCRRAIFFVFFGK